MECYSPKYNYIMKVHAKSGCSYFRQLFLFLHHNELSEKNKSKLNKHHNIQLLFTNPNKIKPFFTINIVRNPYKRVVSIFMDKVCGGTLTIIINKLNLDKFTFECFIKKLYDYYKIHNKVFFDIHVFPQSYKYNENDIIIKLEDYNEKLIESYNNEHTSELIPKINEFFTLNNIQKNNVPKHDCDNTYIGDIEYSHDFSGPWCSNHECFYNNETKEMVYEIYKRDFEIFGYEK
jgi:hypothetical protein